MSNKKDKTKKDNNEPDKNFRDTYKLLYHIGEGTFGIVCLARCRATKKYYAAKLEERGKKSRIKEEYNFYKELTSSTKKISIPKIYKFWQVEDWNIIIMELLGDSLDQLFIKNKKRFDVGTVLKLGIEITTILEDLHGCGIIHRDIKPNNFMIGHEDNNKTNKLYIIDLGLSKKYMINNKHMPLKTDKDVTGTVRYVSTNIHIGLEPSRRDDLESVAYMLIYFLKGSLPWQGLKIKNKREHSETIGDIKLHTSLSKLCDGLLPCFEKYLDYCRNKLEFTTTPDYEYLKNLLKNEAKSNKIKLKYCWND